METEEKFEMPNKEDLKKLASIISHVCALIIFLYGIFGFNYNPESTLQETTLALWQIKYIIIALFIEAVNYFNFRGENAKKN